MHQHIDTPVAAEPSEVHSVLSDLANYPDFLPLVTDVAVASAETGDAGPAWLVTLRARVGPFARAKRLRMVRTIHNAPGKVRFERGEVDGRDHAAWTLDVSITGTGESRVQVDLSYDGGFWSKPLDSILRSQVTDAIPRLTALFEPPS